MAKGGKKKAQGGVQNRPAYTRVSFLYQAATLLATTSPGPRATSGTVMDASTEAQQEEASGSNGTPVESVQETPQEGLRRDRRQLEGMSRRLLSDCRSVSLKTQIRVSPDVKRTICKFCDTLLVEGKSCASVVENRSRGARKPWADVLVIKCCTCGGLKRYPVAAPRQKRRPLRDVQEKKSGGTWDTEAPAVG